MFHHHARSSFSVGLADPWSSIVLILILCFNRISVESTCTMPITANADVVASSIRPNCQFWRLSAETLLTKNKDKE